MSIVFSDPFYLRSCADHLGRVNVILRSSNFTDIFFETGLICNKKSSPAFKIKTWISYQIFCVVIVVASIFLVQKKHTSYHLVNRIPFYSVPVKGWMDACISKTTYPVSDLDVPFMQKYFENRKELLADVPLVRKRIFDISFSSNFKDGNLNRIPELKLDAG
ncbi:MAG: hypothetical protein ABI594_04030 [Ginsengibacter sp.]